MLDSKKLAKKLRDAMDLKNPPVTGSDLAAACSVTPQAVSGWRSSGRIAKRHIPVIADLTGQPVEYFLTDVIELSGKTGQKENIKDLSGFNILLRAWQEASPENRDTLLRLATTILKLDGTRQRSRPARKTDT